MNFSFLHELIDESYKIRIVDIGASDGDYSPSYQPLIDVGLASLIGFEPNKEACEVLNKKIKKTLSTIHISLVMERLQHFTKQIGY